MTIDFKQDILAPVATDFAAMDKFINEGITSKVALVMAVSKHVVEAGGKRMRPIMCLLAAKACGATDTQMESYRKLAAIIEMLHTATLVHDDVVDESGLRRGRPTANATWNNQTAVLVGDFLISRAFDLLVDLDNMVLLKDFSTGTCEIAEGEVLQLQAQHQPETTEQTYLDIIHGKTSRLFELATEGAAILAGQPQYREPLRLFAGHFGNAFQIIDDILDYTSDAETLGKNIGDDLMEGKPTLPLISALANTQGEEHEIIRKSIATGGTADLERVIQIVQTSGALDYCSRRANEETQAAIQALSHLPESKYRQALYNLAQLALHRIQ
ncbi:Octaprenyl-diphosphate synthase / Dimethylallyltransferase / Geranyltranstransferase (farnesyldiphosphate synthase) / Geranylgeranyl pyrophosphate synthetase [Acinetobacter bereziniae]|uniref:All-trans-nonaprenyl-diphosphate synthase n=1 Tax=Acinetobacter bereziniae TaxID=106648 RepID=UPI0005740AD1|nr:All-trans-nonaprenyl-diphosphate synthase [Acinetobacter bereziniae]MDV8155142.1 All-trans-nonaprenyl-diphosphate synthase [Acinetobacter bereziniae]CEI53879.1 Octaprenyl-diphosphate synthase / Dimethylallyltransferase / Geranyltranstransferase (farnesyldiphosphate synthase) / Geranylgeranyl pyrophosphate synthetase [Acinetobacter bereziniae]